MPHDFPPWEAVYQRTQRWLLAGCFEALVHDLRTLLRVLAERQAQPTAVRCTDCQWRHERIVDIATGSTIP